MDDPFHPHPHGQSSPTDPATQIAELKSQLSQLMNKVNTLELWKASLRGQDGIVINGNVIGFQSAINVQQTVQLSVCINGAPGLVEVFCVAPPYLI